MNILEEGLLLSLTPQSLAAIFFWHCALLCHYYQSIARCRATCCLPVLSPLQISPVAWHALLVNRNTLYSTKYKNNCTSVFYKICSFGTDLMGHQVHLWYTCKLRVGWVHNLWWHPSADMLKRAFFTDVYTNQSCLDYQLLPLSVWICGVLHGK